MSCVSVRSKLLLCTVTEVTDTCSCVCVLAIDSGSWFIVLVSVTGDTECMKGLYDCGAVCECLCV